MNRALSGVELFEWMALRRVSNGGVTMLEGSGWFDTGRPVPGWATETLTKLLTEKLIVLGADPEPGGMRRAALTTVGTTRYEQLGGEPHPGYGRPWDEG